MKTVHKKKQFKDIFCALLMFMLIFVATSALAAEKQDEQKTVRIGYVNVATYEEGGEGEYKRGSGYEYLQRISYITGWKYEYFYGSFKECYDKLVKGEIDLFGNVSYKPERAELFSFSSYPQGKDTYLIYTSKKRPELATGDIQRLVGCKIGVTANSFQEGLLLKWLDNNKINAQVERFTGYKAMMAALDKGELDAIATPDLATSYDYLPIINIGFSDYFFAVTKNRPDLLKELNEALFEIQSSEVDYNFNLVARYHTQMSNALLLNEKEKAWLAKHDNTIRVGFLRHSLPYSGQREGQLVGIMDTIAKTLSKEFGITIENKGYTTSTELRTAIQQGEVDIAGPAYSDFYLAEQKDFVITSAMLSTTPVLVYRDNDVNKSMESIAVADASLFQQEMVGVLFPNAKTHAYKTQMDCLQAVAAGEVGSFITTSSSLNTYRKYGILERLQSAEIARKAEICLFTNKPNRMVASIFNKGISLSSNVLNGSVLMENAYADRKITWKSIVQEYTTQVFAIVGFLFALLAGGLYYLYRTKNKLQQALVDVKNANAAKTTFLNHMSHDIRTPMNAIIGFTNIAMKQKPHKDIQKCLEKIEESSEHLLALINDVLDISRLESGRVKYKPVPVDITKVIDVVINIT